MYGLETIRAMNRTKGEKARIAGVEPMIYNGNPETLRNIPNMGDYRATKFGWKLVEQYFVDSSGWGSAGEPALTFEQFTQKAKVGRGYAIIESGQFQVYIGEFVKVK